MRLNPTVLSILAGAIAGASLSGCGGASQTTETSRTARTEAESIEAPTEVSTTNTTTSALPATNGPPPEEIYAVDCGRG